MPALRFIPYRDIAAEIAARLAAARAGRDPLAPWDEEVIVPSRGVAEAITAELLVQLPHGVAGLRIHSLEELARRILATNGQTPHVASDAERRLAMRVATRSIDDPMMSSRGMAAMLERSWRDVRDSGLTLADFARRAGGVRGLRNPSRTAILQRVWSEYERLIAGIGAIDPADLFARATRLVDERVVPQLLAGFYDMTGAQRQLTEALLRAQRVPAIWIPSEAPFAQPFIRVVSSHAGVVREPVAARGPARVELTAYDTRIDELRGICTRIAGLLAAGTLPTDIGVVARSLDPYDLRLLNRFAGEHGFTTSAMEEIPLSAQRIGRGALTLLHLRDRGFQRSEVLGLVRDGLRTQTRIRVDDADGATRRARIAGGTSEELRRMRNRAGVIETYIALVSELESLTQSLNLERLAELFRIETESDLGAAGRLQELASVWRRVPGATQADFVDAIENATIPRSLGDIEKRPSVWAGEVLRFRGRSFAHLFVTRMQDDVFPQRRTEDPLLPDSDRRLLAIREIGDGKEEEQLLFTLLTDSTTADIVWSYASGDGFGKILRPSRYVRGAVPLVTGRGPADWVQQTTVNSQRQIQSLVQAGTGSVFDGSIGPLDVASLRALSPTQLEDFGECPQKFLLKHILRAEDVDHPERELQIHHRDKGILDHRILERFYRTTGPDELRVPLSEELLERLDTLVDEQFDEHEAIAPPFNRTVRDIERRATRRILREFLAADIADLTASGLRPTRFEYRFGTKHRHEADHPEPFVIDAAGMPVRVEGTIDRIDTSDEGTGIPTRYRIVDYKSGKALRHVNLAGKIDRGVRLQLALYAMAVASFFDIEDSAVGGTIKPIVVGDTKPEKFAFDLAEKRAGLVETLEIFIRAILDGRFPAFPNEDDDFNSCKYCPVNHSCRTRHDPDESYAVQRFGDPRTLLSGDPP